MRVELMLHFGPFALDVLNERLWRGTELVPLRPKPFLLLRYLVAQAGRVVAKTELLKAVWPDTTVSVGSLKAYIHDLRAVLGDDSQVPQFIETVGRRGYRFIAPVQEITTEGPLQVGHAARESAGQAQRAAPLLPASSAMVVGREEELGHLKSCWAQALAGLRQVVFVTGEAGIGKTTVVDTFVAQALRVPACWVGQGQCIEHFGAGEAYLPLLSALGQLCRGPGHERFRPLLEQHAPMWLAQMPALLNAAEQEVLQRRTLSTTRERMLRELAEALEVLRVCP
jgi:DNA-binding winged helix-turn-helix (wHTH) protein